MMMQGFRQEEPLSLSGREKALRTLRRRAEPRDTDDAMDAAKWRKSLWTISTS